MVRFAEGLPRRTGTAHDAKLEARNNYKRFGTEDWEFTDGDYGETEDNDGTELGKFEQQLADALDRLAAVKEPGQPTIFLDFGGGSGVSAIRLAEHNTTNKRLYVVSNLAMEQVHPKVRFVRGDAMELKRLTVDQMPLRGSVDLIHERTALGHSIKGDVDVLHLLQLLSPTGAMIIEQEPEPKQPSDQAADVREEYEMGLSKFIGIENLRSLGLDGNQFTAKTYNVGKTNYVVLARAASPLRNWKPENLEA